MFQFETYFTKSTKQIKNEFGNFSEEYFINNPNQCYVSINDVEKISLIIKDRDFTPEYIKMAIIIKKDNNVVIGFNIPPDLNLWEDYLSLLNDLVECGRGKRELSTNPIQIELSIVNEKEITMTISNIFADKEVLFSGNFPKEMFLKQIISGAREYYNKLIKYDIFNEISISPRTPKEYPEIMLKEIDQIEKDLKKI